MSTKILRTCAVLWALGLAGMVIARAGLELDLAALPFQVAVRFWIVGGLGYTGLGVLRLVSGEGSDANRRPGAPADLSAVVRRR